MCIQTYVHQVAFLWINLNILVVQSDIIEYFINRESNIPSSYDSLKAISYQQGITLHFHKMPQKTEQVYVTAMQLILQIKFA